MSAHNKRIRSKTGPRALVASAVATRFATMVLEVLAGVMTPMKAAASAGIAVQRYYTLENRALSGLIAALEPKPKGRRVGSADAMARLEADNRRLSREVSRLAALVRLSHRQAGLADQKARTSSGRKRKSPSVRALKAIASLHSQQDCRQTEASSPASLQEA